MSINAVKGVEIGDGFACVNSKGTCFRDEMTPEGFLSNHAESPVQFLCCYQGKRIHYYPSQTSRFFQF
jgi:hypothetical protein